MLQEIDSLRTELARLEEELQAAKDEQRTKEEQSKAALEVQKEKWRRKHELLTRSIKDTQSVYEAEKRKYQGQMQDLGEKLQAMREQSRREEEEERRFLMQLDAELVAVAGRAKARLRDESVNCESDTLQDSMCEDSPRPDSILKLISNIAKARELLQGLLEQPPPEPAFIPPLALSPSLPLDLPSASKTLSDSIRDSSAYSKVMINDEVLNSLTMSEREAVVYSIINSGAGSEQRRDVQLEDLLNVTPEERKSLLLTSAKFEDLSSIIEEESGCDSQQDQIALNFTLPDVREELNSSLRSQSRRKGERLTLSPISTPRSGVSRIQSQSYISSESVSQLNGSDLDRGRIEDASGKLQAGDLAAGSALHRIHFDLGEG